MTDENGYGGLGSRNLLKAWQAVVVSDVMEDIRSMLAVCAADKKAAEDELSRIWHELETYFANPIRDRLRPVIVSIARRLRAIPLKANPRDVPIISLIGEIFVRRDEFSRKNIVEYLEAKGFMVRVAPVGEYFCYSGYVVNTGLGERRFNLRDRIKMKMTSRVQQFWEYSIKALFGESGLYHPEMIDVAKTIKGIPHLINENLRGECVLTVGLAMREILEPSCGVVSIGPFGCMPSRVAEAMLKKEMNGKGKNRMDPDAAHHHNPDEPFPFLAIETDGSSFPQIIEANLEAFVLRARRLHNQLQQKAKPAKLRKIWNPVSVRSFFLSFPW